MRVVQQRPCPGHTARLQLIIERPQVRVAEQGTMAETASRAIRIALLVGPGWFLEPVPPVALVGPSVAGARALLQHFDAVVHAGPLRDQRLHRVVGELSPAVAGSRSHAVGVRVEQGAVAVGGSLRDGVLVHGPGVLAGAQLDLAVGGEGCAGEKKGFRRWTFKYSI